MGIQIVIQAESIPEIGPIANSPTGPPNRPRILLEARSTQRGRPQPKGELAAKERKRAQRGKAATKSELATKDRKDRKEKRHKLLSLCSLRSSVARSWLFVVGSFTFIFHKFFIFRSNSVKFSQMGVILPVRRGEAALARIGKKMGARHFSACRPGSP
jgi:hypothetical protein